MEFSPRQDIVVWKVHDSRCCKVSVMEFGLYAA